MHLCHQASQTLFSQPPAGQSPTSTPTAPTAPPNAATAPGGATAGEGLNPELFTGIVQGVLSTMMGSLGTPQNETESIAQFIQRLSQTSNIFTPGTGDAMGELFGVNAFPFSSFRFLYPSRMSKTKEPVFVLRFLRWSAGFGLSELLYGGHGVVAPRAASATWSYPAPSCSVLHWAFPARPRAHRGQHHCKLFFSSVKWPDSQCWSWNTP